jgi:hypothetical protein
MHQPDYDQNHRPRASKIKSPAPRLIQQQQDSQRDYHRRSDVSPDGATLAVTVHSCAHPFLRLTLPAHAIFQHDKSHADQQQRHEQLPHPEKIEKTKVVQQKKRAHANQNDRPQWPLGAPALERI